METTAGILRHFHELGRSSPVRWVLDRVNAPAARAPSPASTRQERWQDLFWEHAPAQRAAPRMQAAAVAQTDLFGWLATENPAAQPVAASRPAAAAQPRSRAEALAKPAPAASVRKLRSVAPAGYAQRRRTVNSVEVVRLLQVTRGVNGVEAPPAIELPRSRFSAAVDLWKGRPVGTPFVMATSGQRAARNK